MFRCGTLQALKTAGVTEVVLAINYQPKVRLEEWLAVSLFNTSG